jgi:SCP-2 sterol transfer family
MHEVVGVGDGTTGGTLAATAAQLTWGHRQLFGRLSRMAAQLRDDPSPRTLAAAITLYHVVVEGSLAQPGQHMIERSLTRLELLPAFRAGMANVALDEQRHIAFGVRLLADLAAADPACADAILQTIREVLPWTATVAMPPGDDPSYIEPFGFTLEDLYTEAARSQEARLRAIGLPVDELPRFPLAMDLSPRERARRGLALVRGGMLGPKRGPPTRDPQVVAILFDTIRRRADPAAVPPGTTVQWAFTDAEPWYLRVADGHVAVQPGHAPHADVTLRSAFEDFTDVTAGRVDPRRLMLKRRMRVSGSPRMLLRLGRLLA